MRTPRSPIHHATRGAAQTCKRLFPLCCLFLLWCATAQAAPSAPAPQVYTAAPFYILYETSGRNAVPPTDADADGVPDSVTAVATQLLHAREVLHHQMGLRDPLTSPRYAGVRRIEVRIMDKSALRGCNGRAFDELTPSRLALQEHKLTLHIARHVDAKRNVTPAHEYFHLVQNGYTYFKNPWYYEGLARYMEGAFRPHTNVQTALATLPPPEHLQSLSYQAADTFWGPWAAQCGKADAGRRSTPPPSTQNAQNTQSPPVYPLNGIACIRTLLEQLDAADDNICAARQQSTPTSAPFWTEAQQRHVDNTPVILDAVKNSYGR